MNFFKVQFYLLELPRQHLYDCNPNSNTMQVPLDDAVLTQTLRSQLRVSPDPLTRPPAGLVNITQGPAPERTPDEGETCAPVRIDAWQGLARRPRPTSPTTRPRIPRNYGPIMPTLIRPAQIYRHQIPGRLRRLSRPGSSGLCLPADCRYKDLLQEAVLLSATNAVPEVQTAGFQDGAVPSPVAHEFWPLDAWDIRHTLRISRMGPSEMEDQSMMPYAEAGEDETSESSNHSLSDGIDQPEKDRPRLDPDHRLWRVKDSIVQHAHARFSQSYQPTQKETMEKWTPLFACPFFRKDPARHWPCLADTSMTTIRGVKQHLWRRHSQPYYCPICYGIFPVASERDTHITKRACEKKDMIVFDGMTPEQKTLLSAGFKGYSMPEQWREIWKLLFGKPPKILEPFLTTELSWKITLVTEFWKAKGKEITEQFLGDMGAAEAGLSTQGCDDTAVPALVNAVLQDMVGLVFWRSALGLDLRIMPALELAI